MKILLFLPLIFSLNAHSKLLDKVVGVVNDKVFTLSELNRVNRTISIRKEIAPFIYKKSNYSTSELLKLSQNQYIIKDKLSELGYVISDESVESRILETQKALRLNRAELNKFLESKNLSFNEYFEIIRDAMEFNIFNRRIIAPLVTITEQELKNTYYKSNKANKALTFKYNVTDFHLPSNKINKNDYKSLPLILETYQATGSIPQIYSDISTNKLGDVRDEDLPSELRKLLKNTDEKKFSKPYIKDNLVHIFFLNSKDLIQSADFLNKKNKIYQNLFMKRAENLSSNWFSRESLNYYILENL